MTAFFFGLNPVKVIIAYFTVSSIRAISSGVKFV